MKQDAIQIIRNSISAVSPAEGVKNVISRIDIKGGRVFVISVGKAAVSMAKAAQEVLQNYITVGVLVTKYGYLKEEVPRFTALEAGHPYPDENSCLATEYILRITENLDKKDHVIFLLSGGASSLFELPQISVEELQEITDALLKSGADIREINRIRKRLSKVKGGRFAKHCEPAKIHTIVLSDVIGDPLDVIGSGPTYPDASTVEMAKEVVQKYGISLSEKAKQALETETPKSLSHVETAIVGNVAKLVRYAKHYCEGLGYRPIVLTDRVDMEAKELGRFLGQIAKTNRYGEENIAFIVGGETVVHVKGTGKGGRNQEICLAGAKEIAGLPNAVLFSIGSDGTDGPTDAAGALVTGSTKKELKNQGIDLETALENNDSYNALKAVRSLVVTGPTGTNVNDLTVLLIRRA